MDELEEHASRLRAVRALIEREAAKLVTNLEGPEVQTIKALLIASKQAAQDLAAALTNQKEQHT